ncbi:MAG: PA2779 family protein [Acidobacteriota bacterium]|nr:PA2779 family protein [Acidobacteriota bacterium]
MNSKRNLWLLLPLLMSLLVVNPKTATADEHVMPLSELHQQAQAASQERTKNVADIERVLSYPAAAEALQKAAVNQAQVQKAVATLDDAELARLADRARASEKDVQGGLIVGILALIGLIVVIIIVVALVG